MNIKFADRMKDYEEGIFQVLNEKKIEREKAGKRVFNFSVGTPDFKPPQHIVDAFCEAAGEAPSNARSDLPQAGGKRRQTGHSKERSARFSRRPDIHPLYN